MKHITNYAPQSYKELWGFVFPKHYQDKYDDPISGLSGGGGNYPFYDIHIKNSVVLKPKSFALGVSIEYFNVPYDYYLRTANKSSMARRGIDASFNTLIDNGFRGYLIIEIANHTNDNITLIAGQPILKVEAVKCLFKAEPYNGKYQDQPNKPVEAILNESI